MTAEQACELCDGEGGSPIFRSAKWRVVRVTGAEGEAFPGFCRVVWNEHVREMSDLETADRALFMEAVFRVESALRTALKPHKMNLASLGNLTPHLHWHVIPRYQDDIAFPKPIWAVNPAATQPGQGLGTLGNRRLDESAQTGQTDNWEVAIRRALETA
jgi:diadenosine tetraphosphate (Ap4A) HIT family hydrolase